MTQRIKASPRKGFTLVELLVVISIIALLSSVILAAVIGARAKGANARIQEEVALMRNDLETNRNGDGTYAGFTVNGTSCFHVASIPAYTSNEATDIVNLNGGTLMTYTNVPPSNPPYTNIGLIVFTDANSTGCGSSPLLPTKYAIYAAYVGGNGQLGYFCKDSSGKTVAATTTPSSGYGAQEAAAGTCI